MTPVPRSSTARPSVNVRTHALCAEYVPSVMSAATDATLRMAPRPRAVICPAAACDSTRTARTMTSSTASSRSTSPPTNRCPGAAPALLTSSPTGRSVDRSRSATRSTSPRTDRSATRISTRTPAAPCQLTGQPLEPLGVPVDEDQVVASGGELPGELEPQAGGRAGDQCGTHGTTVEAAGRSAGRCTSASTRVNSSPVAARRIGTPGRVLVPSGSSPTGPRGAVLVSGTRTRLERRHR